MNEIIQQVIAKDSLCRELGISNLREGEQKAFLCMNYSKEDLEVFLNDV